MCVLWDNEVQNMSYFDHVSPFTSLLQKFLQGFRQVEPLFGWLWNSKNICIIFLKVQVLWEPDQPPFLHLPWLTSHEKQGLSTSAQCGEAANSLAMYEGFYFIRAATFRHTWCSWRGTWQSHSVGAKAMIHSEWKPSPLWGHRWQGQRKRSIKDNRSQGLMLLWLFILLPSRKASPITYYVSIIMM